MKNSEVINIFIEKMKTWGNPHICSISFYLFSPILVVHLLILSGHLVI